MDVSLARDVAGAPEKCGNQAGAGGGQGGTRELEVIPLPGGANEARELVGVPGLRGETQGSPRVRALGSARVEGPGAWVLPPIVYVSRNNKACI